MRSRTIVVAGSFGLLVAAQGCWLVSSLGDLPVAGDAGPDLAAPREGGDADGGSRKDASADGSRDRAAPTDTSAEHPSEPEGGLAEAGGPSQCPDSGYLFCDGFENGLDAWTSYEDEGGLIFTDSAHHFRGTRALHASLPSVAATKTYLKGIVTRVQATGGAKNPLYERVWAYFPTLPSLSTTLVGLNTPADGGAAGYIRGGGGNGEVALLNFDVADATAVASTTKMPTGTWVCLEMEVDGTNAKLWVDGTAVSLTIALRIDTLDVTMQLGASTSLIGLMNAAFDAWFDEVAADNKRIGCEH